MALIVQIVSFIMFQWYRDINVEYNVVELPDDEGTSTFNPCMQNGSNRYLYGFIVLTLLYTMCRYLYTICYAFKLQPFRTIFWALGNLSMLILLLMAAISAYHANNDINKLADQLESDASLIPNSL